MNKNCGHWPLEEGEEAVGHRCLGQMAYLSFRLFGSGWLRFICFSYIYFILITYRAFQQKNYFHVKCVVSVILCALTKWDLLTSQRDQKQNEDRRQNTVDFGSEICQTFD